MDAPLNFVGIRVKCLTLAGSRGFGDNAPALNTVGRFTSVYKTAQQTGGRLHDQSGITAAFNRSTPFSTSNFTTAAIKSNGANKAKCSKYCY